MKLKKYILKSAIAAALITFSGCADFTEMTPKGMNLLETTSQLDMLLNYEYRDISIRQMMEISGDIIYWRSDLNTMMHQPIKTATQIRITWDEEAHKNELPGLVLNDQWYTTCYNVIGKIANPIILIADNAKGPEIDKKRVKGEALTLRAYFHYLAVQKYAKAYNPATAETENAIVYVTENTDIKSPAKPLNLKDYYKNIIADVDAAIATGGLPDANINRMRMSLPCAYAVKALALMAIQDFDGAEAAAKKALEINSTIVDYNTMTTEVQGSVTFGKYNVLLRPRAECAEDYFNSRDLQQLNAITPYGESMFEKGHAVHDKFNTDRVKYDFTPGMGDGIKTLGPDYDWTLTNDRNSSWGNIGLKSTQMYLILAETSIAKGKYDDAMKYLDAIREKRIDPSIYAPLAGTVRDKATAIKHLRQTAHGENIFTVYNFIDRKRWTQLDDYKQTLTRTFGDVTMTLTPESALWVFPLPQSILALNPYLKQNL